MTKKVFVILMGVVMLVIGVFSYNTARGLSKRCTVPIVGTVVDVKVEESVEDVDDVMRTVYTYYPIIEYQVGDKTITKQSNSGSGSPEYKINDKIDILYNPDKVEEYIIKGDNTGDIVGIIFVAVGLVITALGVFKEF